MNSASRLFALARVGRRASIVSGCAFTLSPFSLLPSVRRNPLLLLCACPRSALRQLPVVLSPGSGPWPQHYGWAGSAADGGSGRTGFRQASTPAARQGGGWPQQIWRLCRICAADRDSAAWVPRPAFHAVSGDAPGRASISCSSAPPCPAWSAHSAQLVWRTPRHRHCAFSLGQQSRVRWPCCIVSGADSPVLPPKVVRAAALVQPQPGWRRQNTLLSFSDTGWIVTERQAALSNSRPYLHYSTSNVFSPLSMASRLVDLWERASSGSDRNAEALRVHPRFFVSCCRVQSFPCLALFALCFVGFVYPRLFVALLPAPLLLRKNLPGRQCAVLGRDIAV